MSECIIGDVRDVLPSLPAESVQMCVTSPPYYGLRDYQVEGQLGLEASPDEYVDALVGVFREVRRLLLPDGTLWLNLGDSYTSGGRKTRDPGQSRHHAAFKGEVTAVTSWRPDDPAGLKPKDLIGIPWRVAFALQADGWYLRQDIIWSKPNPMPESVMDRCTKAHEYLFLLSKAPRYYFDAEAIAEPFADERMGNPNGGGHYAREAFAHAGPNAQSGLQKGQWNSDGSKDKRNKRSVWTVNSQPYSEAHFATFPPKLIEPCILAGSRPGDVVLDPFFGSGTTGEVCERLGRDWLGVELNPEYAQMAKRRTSQQGLGL